MLDAARLSDHAKARIEELQGEGITLSPEQIVRINALGWNIESPETRLALARGVPVAVGGAVLWPMTLRAYDWHCRVANDMTTVRLSYFALAYAMAHGYSDGAELDVYGQQAVDTVEAWGNGLRCHIDALVEAMAQIIQQDEEEPGVQDDEPTRMGVGNLSVNVSAITGMAPDDVERKMCVSHAIAIAHTTLETQAAVAGSKYRPPSYVRATQAMALYIKEIREQHKAESDGR